MEQQKQQQKQRSSFQNNGVEDDEESLVRQVIAENPMEDAGVREEWKQQIGWHQKENIFTTTSNDMNTNHKKQKKKNLQLLRRGNKLSIPNPIQYQKEIDTTLALQQPPPPSSRISTIDVAGHGWYVFMMLTLIILSLLLLLLLLLPHRRRQLRRYIDTGCTTDSTGSDEKIRSF